MRRDRGTVEIPGIVVSKTGWRIAGSAQQHLKSSPLWVGAVFARKNIPFISSVRSHRAVRCLFCFPVLGWQILISNVFPVSSLPLFVWFSVSALVVGAERCASRQREAKLSWTVFFSRVFFFFVNTNQIMIYLSYCNVTVVLEERGFLSDIYLGGRKWFFNGLKFSDAAERLGQFMLFPETELSFFGCWRWEEHIAAEIVYPRWVLVFICNKLSPW